MSERDPKGTGTPAPGGGEETDLLGRREDFIKTFFRKGAELTEELLVENQRLRYKLVALEEELTALRRSSAGESTAAIRELARRIQELEEERQSLIGRYSEVEARSRDYEARFHQIEEENERLANLYVASDQLHSTLDLREVLQIILEIVLNFIGAKQFSIHMIDDSTRRLFPVAAEGVSVEAVPEFPLGQGFVGKAVETGTPYLAAQMNPAPSAPLDFGAPLACIPLAMRGTPVGAIVIYRYLVQKKEIVEVDHALFRLLAAHAATAIVGARHATAGGARPLTRAAFAALLAGHAE
ncbi:MAG TPA: GAF domain-containing protein [Myxococcota bacterium]|jgi:nitrate/nitrite-specific signal transduction histidine kinase|nr:GAF domain-containing protein [Myxococcota bacterium]